MDLIQYYAKFGAKPALSNKDGAQKKSSSSDTSSKTSLPASQDAPKAAPPIAHIHSEPRSDYHFDDAPDSDVDEDDTKDLSHNELVSLMRRLRQPSSVEMRPQVEMFNKSHRIECELCTEKNKECRVQLGSVRCQLCSERNRVCLRSLVFYQWAIRHKFQLSWEKAGEALKLGERLMLSTKKEKPAPKKPAVPRKPIFKKEEKEQPAIASTSREVRTSPRTPVPRIRKEPAGITVSLDTRSRSRGRKRALTSAPRGERKRRKVASAAPEEPEPFVKTEADPDTELDSESVEPGREIMSAPELAEQAQEILSAPQSQPEVQRNASGQVKKPRGRLRKPSVAARAVEARPRLDARLTATERRLDELEARLQMAEAERATRRRVVAELDGALGELEGGGNIQAAAERLRALHSSLLSEEEKEEDQDQDQEGDQEGDQDWEGEGEGGQEQEQEQEEVVPVSLGGSWDANEEFMISDEQDAQLPDAEPEVYIVDDGTVQDIDTVSPCEDVSPTAVDDSSEVLIFEEGFTITDGPMDIVVSA
ncbi:hypothetical protein C8R47DRAFT_1207307 [Mycena vitilis]|nr:hypothetical protein C8R47DRAFT_1207307 [Mycena vitilis]